MSLSTGTLLKRGLHRRCAVCGQKSIFRRWVVMAERCPRCGFRFQREPGQWLGSWFINICMAQMLAIGIILGGALVSYPHPQVVQLLVVGITAMIAFPIWFFPYSRTIWVAIDLAMRPLEFGEGVDPQWELQADLERLLVETTAEPTRERGATDAGARSGDVTGGGVGQGTGPAGAATGTGDGDEASGPAGEGPSRPRRPSARPKLTPPEDPSRN